MSWMKQPKPGAAPPKPHKVDLRNIAGLLGQKEKEGPLPPPLAYLQSQLPVEPMDRWNQPLPLSVVKQERLDRLMAVILAPRVRVRALLLSGRLDTIEADGLRNGYPELYAEMTDQLIQEMARARPPLPPWSQSTLGVFFGRDAALVYNDDHQGDKPDTSNRQFTGKPPLPTPADQTSDQALRR